ncbi:MAG: hypothetical protein V4692_03920 [Bdellovibrionota bacterium]
MYELLMERLTLYFTNERFHDDVARGKKEFFDEAGIMDEENPAFEMRMTQFLEWYLFTRKLDSIGLTPAQYALQLEDFEMTSTERPLFENLALVQHSLFEFQKIRGDDIHIRDLFLDKKIVIHNSPISIGFNRGEYFDGRLIPDGEDFHFSRAFCFHPAEAAKYINTEIKKLRRLSTAGDREGFMLKLMKMRYKYEQYRHLKLDYVYTNEKKVRF